MRYTISMLEFEILTRGLYRRDQLAITYDSSLTMPLTPAIEAWIERVWREKLQLSREQNFRLYDAPLFRLVEVQARDDGTLHVVLGDTSYKEYMATREPEFAQEHSREELGNALAVCSVVETTDGYILYERRQRTAIHGGRFHVIAGFFDRTYDTDASGQPDPFAAMCRELREETGIQAQDIQEQYCLGAVYDTAHPHGELCFFTQLKISLAEVRTRVPEDDEIQHLLALHVTSESLRDFVVTNHGNISSTGEPNLLMYGAMRFGENWFAGVMQNIA
ncbi:MAG TPA: NUDIX hydrolase [Ktedonobacteraceae bacterium]|nr:NUDIX hydrolase [Ktedonobacteraceae bacterium]